MGHTINMHVVALYLAYTTEVHVLTRYMEHTIEIHVVTPYMGQQILHMYYVHVICIKCLKLRNAASAIETVTEFGISMKNCIRIDQNLKNIFRVPYFECPHVLYMPT